MIRQAIDQERKRRSTSKEDVLKPLKRMMSPAQLKFIQDPHRFKIARCARRSGKSWCGSAYMLMEALSTPNTPILYLGLTRSSAQAAVWDVLITILNTLNIPYEARPSALKITFRNRSFIRLFGADATNARDRLRGQKYKLVVVDEVGFLSQMDGLIPALLPTLADYAGTLAMLSSPGVLLSGFFYEADVGKFKDNWSQHSWTLLDNPHFQKPASNPAKYANRGVEELDVICKTLYGGNRQHPAFLREYLGQWVRDNTSLVYPYTEANLITEPYPLQKERYAIGVDLGVSSASAISVVKYSEYSRKVQFVDCWKAKEVLIDDFADILKDYMKKYNTSLVVADTGGLGAAIVQELRKRYELPIKAADKQDKAFYQRIMANDLISGYVQAVRGLGVLSEWDRIVKNEEGEEVKGQENHTADSALYIYRYIYQTHLKSFVDPETDEDKMIRQLEHSVKQEKLMEEEERDFDY
jgi:hypothetical protein